MVAVIRDSAASMVKAMRIANVPKLALTILTITLTILTDSVAFTR